MRNTKRRKPKTESESVLMVPTETKLTLHQIAARVPAFLKALGAGASVKDACKKAKLPRSTVYDLRNTDKLFKDAWDREFENGTDGLEDEATRRARDGTRRKIYQGGKEVGFEIVYSDRLMEIMLKARRPQVYRERIDHEHSGKGGRPIPISIKSLSDEQLAELKKRILAGATSTPAAGRSGDHGGDSGGGRT